VPLVRVWGNILKQRNCLIIANATGTNAVLANHAEGQVSLFVQTVLAQSTQQ